MMEEIRHTDNANTVVGNINTNFGDDVVDVGNSATDNTAALNHAFEGVQGVEQLSIDDNAVDYAEKLNTNFGLLDENVATSFKFYHISDIHNEVDALDAVKELMTDSNNGASFTILTGDYSPRTGAYPSGETMDEKLRNFGNGFLLLTGNHDIYNGFSKSSVNATALIKAVVQEPNVVWGDANNKASYYHIDYPLGGGRKLRVIVLDSYEYWADESIATYDTVYTTKQVNWFIARIKELTDKDFLLVALHEPPINSVGATDASCVAKRRLNKFCSAKIYTWDTSRSNAILPPTIINAYKGRLRIRQRIANQNTSTGNSSSSALIDADFRFNKPCTFLGYLCGHMHADMCEYSPDYPDQLIMCVDWANSHDSSETDITNRANGILINEVTLDFENSHIVINRIGLNQAVAANGFPALTRDTITFPFVKQVNR